MLQLSNVYLLQRHISYDVHPNFMSVAWELLLYQMYNIKSTINPEIFPTNYSILSEHITTNIISDIS